MFPDASPCYYPVASHAAGRAMKQKEYVGYRITVISRAIVRNEWRSDWTAARIAGGHAQFKSGEDALSYPTEAEADDAGLLAGCVWVDAFGKH
jgi:hypothetical protein